MHVAYPSAHWTLNDMLNAARRLTTKDHWGLMLHDGPGANDKPIFSISCGASAPITSIAPVPRAR